MLDFLCFTTSLSGKRSCNPFEQLRVKKHMITLMNGSTENIANVDRNVDKELRPVSMFHRN